MFWELHLSFAQVKSSDETNCFLSRFGNLVVAVALLSLSIESAAVQCGSEGIFCPNMLEERKKTCWRRQWQDIGPSPLSSSLYAPPTHSHKGKAMWTKCIQWFKFNPLKDRFHTKWRIWFPIKLTIFNCMGDERWVCVVYLGLKGKMCAVKTDKVLGLRFPASIRVRFDHRLRALLVSHYHKRAKCLPAHLSFCLNSGENVTS